MQREYALQVSALFVLLLQWNGPEKAHGSIWRIQNGALCWISENPWKARAQLL